jgi:hypothetical protein
MPIEHWNELFNLWKEWKKGGFVEPFPWKLWPKPNDEQLNNEWRWGNCLHSSHILPEPYWGNAKNPQAIFININPGKVSETIGSQADFNQFDLTYNQIASNNALGLTQTNDWHLKRFQWAQSIDNQITADKCLSVELIPWHSEKAADVTRYILQNSDSVINNLRIFANILPTKGPFINTFIVRAAVFMNLLENNDFGKYFNLKTLRHFTLCRGNLPIPTSFMSEVFLNKEHGGSRFIVFYGGASNQMPPPNYSLLETRSTLSKYFRG